MSENITIPVEATTGETPYIFISYAHRDADKVYPEVKRLHDEGYAIWYDEGIDPGNEWPQEIAKALDGCTLFLSFVSANSAKSSNCRNEINYALNNQKQFLAIYIEETELPGGLALRMGDLQAIMKFRMNQDAYAKKMSKALEGYLPKEGDRDLLIEKEHGKSKKMEMPEPPSSSSSISELNLKTDDVGEVVKLALQLKEKNRDNLKESELEEVCLEMGVSREELTMALAHLQQKSRSRKIAALMSLAVVLLLSFLMLNHWSGQPVVTQTQSENIGEDMEKREQRLSGLTAPPSEVKEKLTLAVLPFKNQSGNPDLDGLAASCGDAMMIPLSGRPRITLIERMQLQKVIGEIDFNQTKYVDPKHAIELGKVMNADYVILGSLQMAKDIVRISARIVATEDGGVLYQERVEGPKGEIFDLQDVLAKSLATKI